ncbi:hypothetical protein ABPG75_001096 [Micractinium tetrahymenae]
MSHTPPVCAPHGDIIQAAVDREEPPQLSQAQLLWIAALLDGLAAQRSGAAEGLRFLVFGVGLDSDVWAAVNCQGRTAFLEDSEEWIGRIRGSHPGLEVHHVTYQGRLSAAQEFFKQPWLMDVPQSVQGACWDAILVDAPRGFRPYHPGCMESAYYAVHTARRCTAAGRAHHVLVFLHDVNRPVESQIVQRIFSGPGIRPLGVIKGQLGDLAAFSIAQAPS